MKSLRSLCLGVVLALSCSGQPGENLTYHEAHGQYLFHTVSGDSATVTINHQEIPGFMEAMAMPFPLHDPSLVEGLGAGEEISFRVAVQGDGSFWVDRIQKIEKSDAAR